MRPQCVMYYINMGKLSCFDICMSVSAHAGKNKICVSGSSLKTYGRVGRINFPFHKSVYELYTMMWPYAKTK